MGSFPWDDDYNDCCYTQHVNGRPLSVVLTEPYDPFEPHPSSFFDDIPYIESDFATLRRQHHRHHHHHHHHQQQQHQHRSRSSGRRLKREYYSFQHHPNVNHNSYCFSSSPPPCRPIHRVTSREVLIEKIERVTVEEQRRPPPPPPPTYSVSFVRAPSPPVRQLKIRPRPSSCFDLHQESTDFHHQQKEDRWSKIIDEHREEHFEYNYNYNYKAPERIVPIERELLPPPPPPPRTILHDATTSTEDLYIPPPPPPPKPVRPETRETGTTTAGLPKRPLCVTETQVIERFEKTEKVRCDSTSSIEGPGSDNSSATIKRSLPRSSDDGEFVEKSPHRVSKKAQRKDFVQRMHARNGTLTKPCNTLNVYTAADRKREKSRVIVRPTSYPREILVDTCGIYGTPGEFSEPTSPQTIENSSTTKIRSPFQPPDLL